MPTSLKKTIGLFLFKKSLLSTRKENNLSDLITKMEKVIPAVNEQYTFNNTDKELDGYFNIKIRNQQAFQLQFTLEVIENYLSNISNSDSISIIDVGDSSGNHLLQLQALNPKITQIASVNIDEKAIEKIKAKGIQTYHCRAEDLAKYGVKVDILISFQMLEHLTDPARFLHSISESDICERFIFSVPYVKNSRVGLQHIKVNMDNIMHTAETVHIFELSPSDWKLLSIFSGWEVVSEKTVLQYPKGIFGRIMKSLWKKYDFEGFYILELKKNNKWSSLYNDW